MVTSPSEIEFIEIRVTQLFALVSEALAGATEALLSNDAATGLAVVEGDSWKTRTRRHRPCVTWSGSS